MTNDVVAGETIVSLRTGHSPDVRKALGRDYYEHESSSCNRFAWVVLSTSLPGQLAKCRMEELHRSARALKDRDPIAGLDIRRSHAAGLSTRVSRMIKRRVEGAAERAMTHQSSMAWNSSVTEPP